MLPGTLVYVNAGTAARAHRLAAPASRRPRSSPRSPCWASFRWSRGRSSTRCKARRVYARWPRPRRFDRNLVVIGAGSAGLVSAYIAAAVQGEGHAGREAPHGRRLPQHRLRAVEGADPLGEAARRTSAARASSASRSADARVRLRRRDGARAARDRDDRAARLGRALHRRSASSASGRGAHRLAVGGRGHDADGDDAALTTRSHRHRRPARGRSCRRFPGSQAVGYLTSDTVWDLRELPRAPASCSAADRSAASSRRRSRASARAVTQVEMVPRILLREDPEVSSDRRRALSRRGHRRSHRAQGDARSRRGAARSVLVAEHDGARGAHRVRRAAVRRRARGQRHGLRARGARHPADETGRSRPTASCRPTLPNIYACGDVAGPLPVHAHRRAPGVVCRGQRAVRPLQEVPRRLLGHPVGHVHRSGGRARGPERGRRRTREDIAVRGHASTASTTSTARSPTSEAHGFVKVLTAPGKDRILGATIVGEHAGDLHRRVRAGDEARHRPEQASSARSTSIRRWPRPTSTRPAPGSARMRRSGFSTGSAGSTHGGCG